MNYLQIIKRLKQNETVIDGALFSLFSFINRGLSFVLLIVLANFISPSEYGYLNLFNTVLMVLGYFMAFSTDGYMSVIYFHDKVNGINNSFTGITLITIVVSTILVAFLYITGDYFPQKLDLPIICLYMAIIICFFTVFVNLNLDLFRLQSKVKLYGVFSCSNAIINFIFTILLVVYLHEGWMGRIYAQTISYLLFGVISLSIFSSQGCFVKPNLKFIHKMLLWGIPLIPHLATSFVRQGCDRFIINNYYTIEDVGIFSLALNLSNVIAIFGSGFNQSNSITIYKTLGLEISNNDKWKTLNRQRHMLIKLYIIITIVVIMLFSILIPCLMPRYISSIPYFIILSFYGLGICLYLVYTNYLFYYQKTKKIMQVTFISSLAHLVFSILLTRYSLYYTCCIYVISQFIVVLMIRRLALKEIKKYE